jgi:hypothetical protein
MCTLSTEYAEGREAPQEDEDECRGILIRTLRIAF